MKTKTLQGRINVRIEQLDAFIQFHENEILRILQKLRAVGRHDVRDGDVRNREDGAMLVYDADAAAVDGGSAAHALQLDSFGDGIEHLDEDDAEFASFKLVEIGNHDGDGDGAVAFFSEKNRLTECFYENIVPFGLLARKVINML